MGRPSVADLGIEFWRLDADFARRNRVYLRAMAVAGLSHEFYHRAHGGTQPDHALCSADAVCACASPALPAATWKLGASIALAFVMRNSLLNGPHHPTRPASLRLLGCQTRQLHIRCMESPHPWIRN